MNTPDPLQDHKDAFDCPCNPMLWEMCPQCDPFQDCENDDKIAEQFRMAIAVHVPMVGVRAQRPKRSRKPFECYYCGGNGVIRRTLDEIKELGEKLGATVAIHRKKKDPEPTSAADSPAPPGTEPASAPPP